MSSENGELSIGTAIDFTGSQLELLDANCRTAFSFGDPISEREIIEGMGRRAKARKRAALKAANQAETLECSEEDPSSVLSDETNCEIPSVPTKPSPSRIPVLQKGHHFERLSSYSENSSTSPSKIPRPKAQLEYLRQIDVENNNSTFSTLSYEMTSELPPSFTDNATTVSSCTHITQLTDPHPDTMPLGVSPLPICISTVSTSASCESEEDQVLVVAEANGTEMQFDVQKVVAAFGLDFAGIRII